MGKQAVSMEGTVARRMATWVSGRQQRVDTLREDLADLVLTGEMLAAVNTMLRRAQHLIRRQRENLSFVYGFDHTECDAILTLVDHTLLTFHAHEA